MLCNAHTHTVVRSLMREDAIAFVRNIRENPDDNAPRLIFADWLREHNEEEWADVICHQCSSDFSNKQFESIDGSSEYIWSRGFIVFARTTLLEWLQKGQELVQMHLISKIEIFNVYPLILGSQNLGNTITGLVGNDSGTSDHSIPNFLFKRMLKKEGVTTYGTHVCVEQPDELLATIRINEILSQCCLEFANEQGGLLSVSAEK